MNSVSSILSHESVHLKCEFVPRRIRPRRGGALPPPRPAPTCPIPCVPGAVTPLRQKSNQKDTAQAPSLGSIDCLRASLTTLICTFENNVPARLLAPSDPREADSLQLRYKDADTYKRRMEARKSSTKECWALLYSQLEETYCRYLANDLDGERLKQTPNASKNVPSSNDIKSLDNISEAVQSQTKPKSHPVVDLLDSLARNPTRSRRTTFASPLETIPREQRGFTKSAQDIKPRAKDTSDLVTERRGRPRRFSFHGFSGRNEGSARSGTNSSESFEAFLRVLRLLPVRHRMGVDSSARRASAPSTNVVNDPKTTAHSTQNTPLITDRNHRLEGSFSHVGDEFSVQPSSVPVFLRRQLPEAEPYKIRFPDTRNSIDTASLKPVPNSLDIHRGSSVDLKPNLELLPHRGLKDSPLPRASSLENLELALGTTSPSFSPITDSLQPYPKRPSLSSDSEAGYGSITLPAHRDCKVVFAPHVRPRRVSFFRDIFVHRNSRTRRSRLSRR